MHIIRSTVQYAAVAQEKMATTDPSLGQYDRTQAWLKAELEPHSHSVISAFIDLRGGLIYAHYFIHEAFSTSIDKETDKFELYFIYALQNFELGRRDEQEPDPKGRPWLFDHLMGILRNPDDDDEEHTGKLELRGLDYERQLLEIAVGHAKTKITTVARLLTFPQRVLDGQVPSFEWHWKASLHRKFKEASTLLHVTVANAKEDLDRCHARAARSLERTKDQLFFENDRYISRFIQTRLGKRACERLTEASLADEGSLEYAFATAIFRGYFHDFSARQMIRHLRLKKPDIFKKLRPLVAKVESEDDAELDRQSLKARQSKVVQFVEEITDPNDAELGRSERPDLLHNKDVFAGVSPKGGVGKSTVMLSLAVHLALSGKKTCFIELDISNPILHFLDNGLNSWACEVSQSRRHLRGGDDPISDVLRAWRRGTKDFRGALETWLYKVPGVEKGHLSVLHARSYDKNNPSEISRFMTGLRDTKDDTAFVDDMVRLLRELGYEKTVIDTSAGLTMLTAGVLAASEVDCHFFVATPTRLGLAPILQQIGLENGTTQKRHILVNQIEGYCDEALFGNPWAIYDEAAHWADSGSFGAIRLDQLERIRSLLFADDNPMSVFHFDSIPALRFASSLGEWVDIISQNQEFIKHGFMPGVYEAI